MSSSTSPLIDASAEPEDNVDSTAATNDSTPGPQNAPRQASLYRAIWRWHFYAGLIVAPFFFFASATGALYVFSIELSNLFYADKYFVTPTEQMLSYDEQLAKLKEQAADFTELDGMRVWNDRTRTTHFIAHAFPGGHTAKGQMHRIYYVNPYTGSLLGSQLMEHEFFHIVLDLHRSVCAGTFGRLLVELATSWGIVLVITGVYLWWPRKGEWRSGGIFWPRLSAAFYVALRDLHSIAGIFFAPLAVIVLFTGLFVSLIWGTGFNWVSMKMEQSLMEFFTHANSPPASDTVARLQPVVTAALQHSQPGDDLYFQLAEKPEHAHKIYVMYKGDTNTVRGLDIDQYTGNVMSTTTTEQLEPMVRLLAIAVSLHQGKTFGLTSKVIAFVTCLVLMGLSVTGIWMWWVRRPKGQTGFPSRLPTRIPGWLWCVIAGISVAFPAVGASLVVIISVEVILSSIRRTRSTGIRKA
ncbi:MAG: peptidase [Schlesneria sp.]|nr:peptidase [Schlesneria sp.]